MPPVTCEWNFYIASDDSSKLYLSSNDDPANKNLVASVDGWTFKKQWTKYGEAQKGTVSLVKGELITSKQSTRREEAAITLLLDGNALNMVLRCKSLAQSTPQFLLERMFRYNNYQCGEVSRRSILMVVECL
mmetsp:Transcript_32827/g.42409  ORF Transcript_32827/g.42409 Transcript_32827/m.42409 type:complete len:132 (+) Transcript_32827:220-615(+)